VSNASADKFTELQDVLRTLLGPDGCPWDRAQSPASLCDYIVEEAHELAQAIRRGSSADVAEELGDVFFLLTFVAFLYERQDVFSTADVFERSKLKMIRRHPHVFSDAVFASVEEQLAAWEAIKKNEHAAAGKTAGLFGGLPASLPSLIKAYRIHSRAAGAGFTWSDDTDVEQQVEAEWLELLDSFASQDKSAQEHELGDLLFTLAELGRRKGIKADAALDAAAARFLDRFAFMEEKTRLQDRDFASLDMEEKNALWEEAKRGERAVADRTGVTIHKGISGENRGTDHAGENRDTDHAGENRGTDHAGEERDAARRAGEGPNAFRSGGGCGDNREAPQ
jgi:ATP diphosphatase